MSLEKQEMVIKGAIEAVLEAQTSREFILNTSLVLMNCGLFMQDCDKPEQPQHFKME